jgi:hypothetical protein
MTPTSPATIAAMATVTSSPGPAKAAAANGLAARLRRMPRRQLLVIALLPVLVLAWLPLLRGGAPTATTPAGAELAAKLPPDAPTPAAPPGETALVATMAGGSPAAILALGERLRAVQAPFVPRWRGRAAVTGDAPLPAAAIADHTPAELTPTAILLTRNGPPVAIVQGKPQRVGDQVLGYTIVAIAEGRVDYVQGSRHLTVPLPNKQLGAPR